MGNICVFCGKKLGLLDRYFFEVFKTKQTACKDCLERLSALSGPELEAEKEQMLASPYLEEVDTLRAYAALSRPCSTPGCGGKLECERENVRLGREGLPDESYSVDVFACPRCGKVELFTAGTVRHALRPKKPEKKEEPTVPTVLCPVCGTRHEEGEPCPVCAAELARQNARPARRREKKPPWEK